MTIHFPEVPHPGLNGVILALYQKSVDCPLSEFKPSAMRMVHDLVKFDSGIWITTDIVSDTHNSVYLHNQTQAMLTNYFRTVGILGDALASAVIANPGKTIDADSVIPYGEFVSHPTYQLHCRHFGMEHTLCTGHITPITNIHSAISFYRADPDSPFTESDRLTKEALVPHMVEAMRINLFSFLRQGRHDRAGTALAICDSVGNLFETTGGFPDLMRTTWPDWRGPKLALPVENLVRTGPISWSRDEITFEASPSNDLFLVSAHRSAPLDSLTARQRQVAVSLSHGKRYKDIARELGISPSTVTKYVNQINSRLRISRREELIKLFGQGPVS